MKKVLQSTVVLTLAVGCGKDSGSGHKINPRFVGTWEGCVDHKDGGSGKGTYTFSKSSKMISEVESYAEKGCTGEKYTLAYGEASLAEKGISEIIEGGKTFGVETQKVSVTALSDLAVSVLNSEKYCDIDSWAVGKTEDLSNCADAKSKDDDQLEMGVGDDDVLSVKFSREILKMKRVAD
ncbi:MAG: hypothetical protein AB7T49_06215 [Oligoflexales bacterium]